MESLLNYLPTADDHIERTTDTDEMVRYISGTEAEYMFYEERTPPHYIRQRICSLYPDLCLVKERRDTFNGNWPRGLSQKPTELAEAGFFYTNRGDAVTCFSCNMTIGHWETDDNPWIEHAIWSPRCNHVRLIKGDTFIKSTNKLYNERIEKYKPPGYVRSPVDERIDSSTDSDSSSSSSIPFTLPKKRKLLSCFRNTTKRKRTCIICLDKEISVIFLTCGHFVSCETCASAALKHCPLCRKRIRWLFRIFYA